MSRSLREWAAQMPPRPQRLRATSQTSTDGDAVGEVRGDAVGDDRGASSSGPPISSIDCDSDAATEFHRNPTLSALDKVLRELTESWKVELQYLTEQEGITSANAEKLKKEIEELEKQEKKWRDEEQPLENSVRWWGDEQAREQDKVLATQNAEEAKVALSKAITEHTNASQELQQARTDHEKAIDEHRKASETAETREMERKKNGDVLQQKVDAFQELSVEQMQLYRTLASQEESVELLTERLEVLMEEEEECRKKLQEETQDLIAELTKLGKQLAGDVSAKPDRPKRASVYELASHSVASMS